MRLIKYLNEGMSVEEVSNILIKDCQPFIKDWQKLDIDDFLYSGRKDTKIFLKKTVRKDRRPLSTPLSIHQDIDDWFYKKFGVRSRSNSVFVTAEYSDAAQYGNVYMVFPIGKYKIISSPIVDDFVYMIKPTFRKVFPGKKSNMSWGKLIDSITDDEYKTFIDYFLKEMKTYKYKEGLQDHKNEQMLTCKNYYLVSFDSGFKYKLMDILEDEGREVQLDWRNL